MDTEEKNPNHLPQRQQSSHAVTTFNEETIIQDQPLSKDYLVEFMVAKWMEVRKSLLQMPDSVLPNEETIIEEAREMKRLLTVYSRLTPKQFSEAIRKAAREKARFLSENPHAFPKLYCYDIEDELQAAGRELLKAKPEPLQLAQNTGGNAFFGEPSEALAREWPKIVENTKRVRQTISPKLRDRFWYGGSAEQRESAVKMLRQMVHEIHEAGKWDLRQNQWESLAIWQSEFASLFPSHTDLIEGMACPIDLIQVDDIKKRLLRRGVNSVDFPDVMDSIFCATFDAYWKFKGE